MERKRYGEEDDSRIDNFSRWWIWQIFGMIFGTGVEAYRVMLLCTADWTDQLANLCQQISSGENLAQLTYRVVNTREVIALISPTNVLRGAVLSW